MCKVRLQAQRDTRTQHLTARKLSVKWEWPGGEAMCALASVLVPGVLASSPRDEARLGVV